MAKTDLTKEIELNFLDFLYAKKYELGILECAIGVGKKYGIVDILSYNGVSVSNGKGKPRTREVTWRCYEIKTSKQDFYSKHKWTFVGNFNFFVMPQDLYEIVKEDIPDGIGCFVYNPKRKQFSLIKRSKRKKLPLSESQLMHDYLVSCHRDARRWANK